MKQLSPQPACNCSYRLRLFAKMVCSGQGQRKREEGEWRAQNVVYKAFLSAPIPIRQSFIARGIQVQRILSLSAILRPHVNFYT
jgi:hypothetical protein